MEKEEVILELKKIIEEKSPLVIEEKLKNIAKTSQITLKTLREELEILKDEKRKKELNESFKEAKEFLDKIENNKISVDVEDYLKCKHADCLRLLEYWIAHYNSFKIINWKEKFLEFKDYNVVVKLVNDEFEDNTLDTIISTYFDKSDLAQQIWNVQPYFYDSSKLWWLWNKEKYKWEIKDDKDILNIVSKNSNANTVNSKEKTEIIEAMQQYGRKKIPSKIKKTWIQFKDLIIDIKTGEEFSATPYYFITNPIPWELHKERFHETPVMDKIFEEWVGKKYVKTLYEILAYCLIPDYPIHRLFCFIGEGMNGKSCFLRLLKKFVGEENVTSTELDILLNPRFEITKLHKKLVCQMGETNFAEMSKTSIIKKLTGQDTIGFEYKNKNPFDEVNYAKILIATNNLPTTTDKTIGFYRRWLIIDFPNRFSEKKDILEEIPDEEYGCLAVKSLEILNDLLKEKKFHNEGDIESRMKKYEDHSDPLSKFMKEYVEEDMEGSIWKFEFEKRLNQWCKENRFRQISEVVIGKKMKEKGIEQSQKRTDWLIEGQSKMLRAWSGIKWKDDKKEV